MKTSFRNQITVSAVARCRLKMKNRHLAAVLSAAAAAAVVVVLVVVLPPVLFAVVAEKRDGQ